MKKAKRFLAIDLGAESGRGIVGTLRDGRMRLEEIHRFPNGAVRMAGSMYWNALSLHSEIKTALRTAVAKYGAGGLHGVGVDSWAVDFVLLDADGRMLSNPCHYRDSRTDGVMEKVFRKLSRARLFEITGLQFMQINTLYQLYSMKGSPALEGADTLLMMADFFNYLLCGRKLQEYTNASTSQLCDPRRRQWSKELAAKLGLPYRILPKLVKPGTVLGNILPEVGAEAGITKLPVIAVASHDTASAVAATPLESENSAFLSSGTWSIIGIEVAEPLISPEILALGMNLTNEGGVEGNTRFIKNINALWLLQECRRKWGADYAAITKLAASAPPLVSFVDCDDVRFLSPKDMEAEITAACRETGQPVPSGKGAVARCILESIALKYRSVLGKIGELAGREIKELHIIGGGSKNALLCQFAANATGRKVIAGPVEATAAGNILMQALATGCIRSVAEGRRMVRDSFDLREYLPKDTPSWNAAYARYRETFRQR